MKNVFLVSMFCLLSFGLFAQEKAKHITLFTNVQVFDGTSDKLVKADIIIVSGDPTKDIKLLMDAEKNIDLFLKDGKIYKNTLRE